MRFKGTFKDQLKKINTKEEIEDLLRTYTYKARHNVESKICSWSRRAKDRLQELEKDNAVVANVSD
jgi:hypothetical protein